ncbi:MAG TPA: response regulator [Anaerolineae bacterium]|nr:response regulator [Anaerolineae bacterium]
MTLGKKPLGLIVEDDFDISIVFREALLDAGFEVEIIRNGRDALIRLAECVPDIVVLDMHMPHVSGDEVLRWIRADNRLTRTRVIVATAEPTELKVQKQADLVLLKPIGFNQLRDLAIRLRPLD